MSAHYRAPSSETVREALRRVATPQLRRAFFEGLQNPLWVEPLAREGVFISPPEPERLDGGLIRDTYWPEIEYLARVAPEAPAHVVDVLLGLQKSTNAWVRRGVFAIGARIPPDQAVRLKPLVSAWRSTGFGWRTDPRDLVSFATNLLEGGYDEFGRWFTNLLFKPYGARGRRKPDHVFEEYWYEKALEQVVPALGASAFETVLSWLVAQERYVGRLKRGSDFTYFYRDTVRARPRDHEDIEQALIDTCRNLAIDAMGVDPESATSALLKTNMLLARKIALFSLAEAINRTSAVESGSRLVPSAMRLLLDDRSCDDSCRIEYAELARAVAAVAPDDLEPLAAFLERGPRVDEDRLRMWLAGEAEDVVEVDALVKDYQDRWLHRWLSSVGAEALPPRLQARLAELEAGLGVIERPLEGSPLITTWVGPTSPVSQDDMAAMSSAQLVAHLESWHDTGEGMRQRPSHEGQGREIAALLATNPLALVGAPDLVQRLRPAYVRAVLNGWLAAFKADIALDWDQVIGVLEGVLSHEKESSFPPEGVGWDDDLDYGPAKRAAVGFLEEASGRLLTGVLTDAHAGRLANLLIGAAGEEGAWEEYEELKSGSMDPLTVSLNWRWPIALRGLIRLVGHGRGTAWFEGALATLERELTRSDSLGASRAVVGEGLARLITADEEWLTSRADRFFGGGAGISREQQIALTTALAVHNFHPRLFDPLVPSMTAALEVGDQLVAGWETQSSPLRRIGEWIVTALLHGHVGPQHPLVVAFFSTVTPTVRGDALGHIAWEFMHAGTVDSVIRDRFAQLWDDRFEHVRQHPSDNEELHQFYWIVRSGKFEPDWWLPRLAAALRLCPGLRQGRGMIGKQLAAAAEVDPGRALEALDLLLEGPAGEGLMALDLSRHATPLVIARAITSGSADLERRARALMNRLGEAGHLSLESEVDDAIAGKVGQEDVEE